MLTSCLCHQNDKGPKGRVPHQGHTTYWLVNWYPNQVFHSKPMADDPESIAKFFILSLWLMTQRVQLSLSVLLILGKPQDSPNPDLEFP